jgi:L,D-peptidoglycan transpeptidase YkuD (ErfK/YbiS/YcfS/YnhG family)
MKLKSTKTIAVMLIVMILVSATVGGLIYRQASFIKTEEARITAEAEAKIKAAEQAEIEAKIKAEEESKAKAEEEARIKAAEEARIKAEEEAKLKAVQEEKARAEVAKKKEEQQAAQKISRGGVDSEKQISTAQSTSTIADSLKTIGVNNQLILVTAKGYGTSNATIRTFERDSNGKWKSVLTVSGFIGRDGFAKQMSESVVQTPRGKFSIGTAFGRYANPGTGIEYRQIGNSDYWVDDPSSSLYNTWQTGSANGRWNSAEKMDITAYNYGFVIGYNTDRTPGKGSAIFFHVSNSYTAGCTGVSQSNMVSILKWLDRDKNPTIIQCPEVELSNY